MSENNNPLEGLVLMWGYSTCFGIMLLLCSDLKEAWGGPKEGEVWNFIKLLWPIIQGSLMVLCPLFQGILLVLDCNLCSRWLIIVAHLIVFFWSWIGFAISGFGNIMVFLVSLFLFQCLVLVSGYKIQKIPLQTIPEQDVESGVP